MAKTNAKNELLNFLRYSNDKIIAARVSFGFITNDEDEDIDFNLYKHYTREELDAFWNFLDVDYDSGYGGQELYGTIWCENQVWYQRGEYDGSEWWERYQYSEEGMPKDLNRERTAKIERILK